jgi:ankyrin repeat protein
MTASSRGEIAIVKLLLAAKADVNAKLTLRGTAAGVQITGFDETALMQASSNGHRDVVALLRAAGARE